MAQPPDTAKITAQLVELRLEHRDLDAAIAKLITDMAADELAIKRLKKRKLRIKDMVAYLENQLIPDLDA
ncbi:MAG: YdcH family protein [Gammaproteobacteria bacterium]|nr:YdcH family protein [Gammaproteobacteria bacterium]